jgi:hypothetical protein
MLCLASAIPLKESDKLAMPLVWNEERVVRTEQQVQVEGGAPVKQILDMSQVLDKNKLADRGWTPRLSPYCYFWLVLEKDNEDASGRSPYMD